MIIGLILEANPYHKGHQYLVNKVKELYDYDAMIAITSTSFTMRGEISIIDKFTKVKTLLNEGIDLVFELPITSTLQSADYFAYNTVMTLNNVGVTDIVIGAENDDIRYLEYFYNILIDPNFNEQLKTNLSNNLSYKKAYEKTLFDYGVIKENIDLFNSPNMTLALQYYTVIRQYNLDINLRLIKRTTSYYQKNTESNNYASASYIRDLIYNNQKYDNYLPYNYEIINLRESEKNINKIINYQLLSWNKFNEYNNINNNCEGIISYIINNANFESYQDLIESLKNKRYTSSRIRRVLLSLILKLPKGYEKECNYMRLLGASTNGFNYLNTLSKERKSLIFSTSKELKRINNLRLNDILEFEISTTKLFELITEKNGLTLNEFKLPIKKEGK